MYWKKRPAAPVNDMAAQAGALGITVPKNTEELKGLLAKFGPMLDEKNRSLITELISELEQGGDRDALTRLAEKMKLAAEKQV